MIEEVERVKPHDLILAVLHSFNKHGREEISLSEFLECFQKLQEKVPLKYSFSKRFLYSVDLLEDLRELDYDGYVRRFVYRNDAFLPKNYITLTTLGKRLSEKTVQRLSDDFIHILDDSTKKAIKNYQERWRLWARPAIGESR